MGRTIVDLSQKINPDQPVFPGSPNPAFIKWSNYKIHGYDSEVIFMSTHTGTHMDCPSHFIPDGATIDKIEANRFYCRATIIRLKKGRGDLIRTKDISRYRIDKGAGIILSTGWETMIDSRRYMENYPGLSEDAAEYLASLLPNLVAIDGPSIDFEENKNFGVHKILLAKNILIVENICNLAVMPNHFDLFVAPLYFEGASGSPVRPFGIISQD